MGRPVLLFALTALSTFFSGAVFGLASGFSLMFGILSIVGSHELGHYLACRYHGVDATLPHFIPLPIPGGFGTLGALIRIRSPFPNRRALFDIGIAGPLAGFVVTLPVLVLAGLEARVVYPTPGDVGLYFGDPLLLHWILALMLGPLPSGGVFAIGSWGMAAWFGLFLTALNLLPIGQLDGGHILYALLPRHAGTISRVAWWICLGLAWYGPNWIIWALLLRFLGRRHPPTLDDLAPLGKGRIVLGGVAAAVFVLCFVPNPIASSWSMLFAALRELGVGL